MTKRTAEQNAVTESLLGGALPVLNKERTWSGWDFAWVNTALAIATWAFLVGGSTALLVGFKQGLAAMAIGNAIGLGIMLLSTVISSQRYRTEQYTLLRPAFGVIGVAIIVFSVVVVTEMGWSSLLGVMAGRAGSQVLGTVTGTELNQFGPVVTVGALIAVLIGYLVLSKGALGVGKFNKIIAPGLAVITVIMMIFLIKNTSIEALFNAQPLAPFADESLNFMVAVEFNAGVGVSWYPVMGSMARMTTTKRAALWPAFAGLFGGTMLAQVLGLAAALTLGDSDPTVWMVPFGGPLLGAAVLMFIAFANITSMSSIVYSTVLAIRQSAGNLLARIPWKVLTALFFVLPTVMAFFPQFMYERFQTFVLLSGAFLASICGVALTDYFIIRRQNIDLYELYAGKNSDLYAYKFGINWSGIAAVAAGVIFYLWIYNPITLETQPLFNFTTATIPAVVLAGAVHLILSKIFYKNRNR